MRRHSLSDSNTAFNSTPSIVTSSNHTKSNDSENQLKINALIDYIVELNRRYFVQLVSLYFTNITYFYKLQDRKIRTWQELYAKNHDRIHGVRKASQQTASSVT